MLLLNRIGKIMGKTECVDIGWLPCLFFVLLVGAVACCAGEDASGLRQEAVPVEVSGRVSPAARDAQGLAADAGVESIGVFAYFTSGDFKADTATPNFMYNRQVEKQADHAWTYSPVSYWPNNQENKVSFFAYAPYTEGKAGGDGGLTFLTEAGSSGFPSLAYVVPAAEADQTDLLAATPLMNYTYATDGGKVKFQLHHTLVKVSVYVESNDDTTGKKVVSFSVKGVKSGTLTYHALSLSGDGQGWGWSYPQTEVTGTFTARATDFSVQDNSTEPKVLLCTFFLLPHGESNTFSITYTYPATSSAGKDVVQAITVKDSALPSLDNWKPGASVSYTVGIARKGITMKVNTHAAWEDGGSETVDGTVD